MRKVKIEKWKYAPKGTCIMEAIATPIVEIEVLGEPMGKQRPRASSWGGHTRIYTPKKTLSYEGRFASAYWDKFPHGKPTSLPIEVAIEATFALNKADYNSRNDGRGKEDGL